MPDRPSTITSPNAPSASTWATDLSPAPAAAVRLARIGGTVAELAAAAISAHTLFHLGGQLGLGPWAAWLLPTALDVFAVTALAVGYNLPPSHPGQKPVLRTARLALTMTLGCNLLDHFLQKAGRLVDPTVRDLLLVAVATLPPLVVERLLNLQSLLVGQKAHQNASARTESAALAQSTQTAGEAALAQISTTEADPPTPVVSPPRKPPVVAGRPDWAVHSREVFGDLVDRLGRRPTGREFQTALADHTKALISAGCLAAGTRPPSITSVKRLRASLEAEHRQ